jgi:hypothetical protein
MSAEKYLELEAVTALMQQHPEPTATVHYPLQFVSTQLLNSKGEQINNTAHQFISTVSTSRARTRWPINAAGRRWSGGGRKAEPAQLALTVRLRSATLHLPPPAGAALLHRLY